MQNPSEIQTPHTTIFMARLWPRHQPQNHMYRGVFPCVDC